jgi:hypothetical protein
LLKKTPGGPPCIDEKTLDLQVTDTSNVGMTLNNYAFPPRATAMRLLVLFHGNSGILTQDPELIEVRPRLLELLAGQGQRFVDRFAICSHQRGIPSQKRFPFFASHDQVYAKPQLVARSNVSSRAKSQGPLPNRAKGLCTLLKRP